MFDIDIPNALYRGMQLDQLEVLGELRKSFEKKKATVEVLRVRHRPTDEEFCLKKMQLICDEDSLLMANELRVLYQLDHPHIVKLYGHFVDGQHVYALYELASKSVKKENKGLSQEESVAVVWQLCEALKYLHSKQLLHRDVNIENLLMNRTKDGAIEIKLIDFEYAAHFSPTRKTQHGTLASLAPEVVMEQYQTEKIDCWGVGVVLFNLLTKSQPFQVKGEAVYDRTVQRIKSLNYSLPEDLNEQAKDLLQSIFVLDPKERLNIFQIMNHPFVRRYIQEVEKIEELPQPPELAAFQSKIAKMQHQQSEFMPESPSNPQHRQLEDKIKKLEAALAAKKAAFSNTKPKDILELEKKASSLQEQFQRAQQDNDALKQKLKESELTCMKFQKEKRAMDEHRVNLEKSKLQLSKINANVQRVLEENNRVTGRITELERQLVQVTVMQEQLKKQEGGTDSDLFISTERQRLVHLKQSPSSSQLASKPGSAAITRTEQKFQKKQSGQTTKSARRLN